MQRLRELSRGYGGSNGRTTALPAVCYACPGGCRPPDPPRCSPERAIFPPGPPEWRFRRAG
eukprot:13164675-Alexandrium_andersonii.AAC.1